MIQKIVVAAFIVKEGKVLLARRPKSKKLAPDKYHLPGGPKGQGRNVPALFSSLSHNFSASMSVPDSV